MESLMKSRVWTLLIIFICVTAAEAGSKQDEAACAEVKEKIRTIQSKMRAGYTRAQGEKYEQRLRELRVRRYKLCR
jgi:hypothetical protein